MTESEKILPIGAIVDHRQYGRGRIAGIDRPFYVIHFGGETRKVPFSFQEMKVVGTQEDEETARIKQALREVLGDQGWIETELEIVPRWVGGTVKLVPGKGDTQTKEIPIDAFFKKVIGIREKLRVLEQKINNHPRLEQEDKLDLQGYITRCYGSLTTFNALFAEKTSQFKGSASDD